MKTNLLATLNWDIRLEPVLVNNSYNTGKKAIIRNDNNELLSIVGKHYEPFTNHQLLHFTQLLTKSGEFELSGFDELNDGKIILAFLKNTNPNLKINGCKTDEYMFIGNSFDGTKRFHIGTASNLIRCSNQFSSTLKVFSKKHNSYLEINDAMTQEVIRKYKAKKSILYDAFEGMESVRVDESVISRLMKEIQALLANDSRVATAKELKMPPSMQTLRKSIDRELKDLGNNAFGLFNGVTWYTTHEMRSNDPVSSQICGTAQLINQKAFRFCTGLKRNSVSVF